ncbi:MAG: cardiolipin synthase [Clostridia bacterium]|nr:cardiolipin synthase [Clostridia bacterium]
MGKKKLSERKKRKIERTVANDRSYKVILYNRFILFLLLVLLQTTVQIGIWISVVYKSPVGSILQLLLWVLSLIFVLHIINKNERPSLKINWIIILLIAPVLGVPFYLLHGEARPTKKMRKKIARAKAEVCQSVTEFYGEREIAAPQTRDEGVSYFLEKYAGYPLFHDGEVEYYESGEGAFPHMLTALKGAEKFILLEYFIIKHGKMWQKILQILLEKAEQGVQIRIIYDDFGCMMSLPPKYERYLEGLHKNIRCMKFNDVVPVFALRMNNRDHRKILVVDGKIAFTGGINLADEYINEERRFGYWKDSAVKITGSAVNSFTQMFFYLWNAFRKDKEDVKNYLLPLKSGKCGGQVCVQPYDDSPLDNIRVGETVYMDAIQRAQKSLYIFTPYLILDDEMRTALCQASLRGVDVRIVTPSVPDKKLVFRMTRANYGILMKAGVKIYEYAPGFIHAKSVLCDEKIAVVGTVNFDYRSLYFHFENAVCFSGCQAVEDLKRDCEATFAVSTRCTPENTKRNVFGRLIDAVFRVFETLL